MSSTVFAEYNYDNFPEVKVIFHGTIQKDSDFTLFTEQWLQLYQDKKEFTFLFDMQDINVVHPQYCYKMTTFISELKQQPIQYLTYSKIININSFMRYLLYIIFKIQSPVAPVEICSRDGSVSRVDP